MNKPLSPAFIDLTQDALLKVFWFKKSFRLFLQQHGVNDSVLSQWHDDQTKREFIGWLWPQFLKSEQGHQAILNMARSLSELEHFPDLERKEDAHVSIPLAMKAVARIRDLVLALEDALQETVEASNKRKLAQEELSKKRNAQESLDKLQKRLEELCRNLGKQDAGYAFERWFYELAVYFELEARPGYHASGRQIDGAITIDGTTYLIETKFTKTAIGSPDIDTFMAKIESKADNTMGLFVSLSGFNHGALRAASKPRTPMLLLDHGHIFQIILRGIMTMPQVVSRIKRHASQTGAPYLPYAEF